MSNKQSIGMPKKMIKGIVPVLLSALALPVFANSMGSVTVAMYPAKSFYTNPVSVVEVPVQDNGCIDLYDALPNEMKLHEGGHLGGYDLNVQVAFQTNKAVPVAPVFHVLVPLVPPNSRSAAGSEIGWPLDADRAAYNDLIGAGESHQYHRIVDLHGNQRRIIYLDESTSQVFGKVHIPFYHADSRHYGNVTHLKCGLHLFGHINGAPRVLDRASGITFEPLSIGNTWAYSNETDLDFSSVEPGARITGRWVTGLPDSELSVWVSRDKTSEKLDIQFLMPFEREGVYKIFQRAQAGAVRFDRDGNTLRVNNQTIHVDPNRDGTFSLALYEPFYIPKPGLYHMHITLDVSFFKDAANPLDLFRAIRPDTGRNEITMLIQDATGDVREITTADMYIPIDR